MNAPALPDELGAEGAEAWSKRVAGLLERATGQLEGSTHPTGPLGDAAGLTISEWTGFPTRVATCLTRGDALRLLDAPTGGDGGRALQEEYVEWRIVRDDGGIRRIEITTELPEYWRVLAAYEPERTLELVAQFAGEEKVPSDAVYGPVDPLGRGVDPAQRERAFRRRMLGTAPSAYNDGRRAISCMVQASNSLAALIRLAAVASIPRVLRDPPGGHIRCLTCTEAIPFLGEFAMPARASDPIIVERLARLAFEGRRVAFDYPLGVYIQDVEHTRLATPDGAPVPRDWFAFGRGGISSDGRARYQRLAFEVPAREPFGIGDLVDLATEQRLRYGGQVADLLQVVLLLRASDPGTLPVSQEPVALKDAPDDANGCRDVRERYERFRAAGGAVAA